MESTEQKYRRLIARADAGEPIIDLAAEAGVKPATLRWWRSELRRREREPDHVESASLIPVRLVSKIGAGPGEPIELVTARGRIVDHSASGLRRVHAGEAAVRPGAPDFLSFAPGQRVFVAPGPTDLRKGFSGLTILAERRLRQDPLPGCVFAYCNRRPTLIKLLLWDGSGFWGMAKRLGGATARPACRWRCGSTRTAMSASTTRTDSRRASPTTATARPPWSCRPSATP